jgi:hypothetical protein
MRKTLFVLLSVPLAAFAQMKVASDITVNGFTHAESIGCDPANNAFYASEFGSKLAPLEKDGAGYISKWSLDGTLVEKKFLPAAGKTMDKPKGIWVQGNRLWTTDIDSVWIFDLETKKGRKLPIPGAQFANDPAVRGHALYVTDNRGDQVFRIAPADFLYMKVDPEIATVFQGKGVNPNGIWPSQSIAVVGFAGADAPRAIYRLDENRQPQAVSDPIGRLDGVYELKDGSLLVTDWNSGSLFQWSKSMGMKKLAEGFKGPADFCVIEGSDDVTAYVPDLVQNHVRIIRLTR